MKKRMKYMLYVWSAMIFILIIFLAVQCEKDDLPHNQLNGRTTAVFNPAIKYGRVFDVDGNIYKTVKIGNQVWMAENLRTKRYRNGDSISNVTENHIWGRLASGAYCSYGNTADPDTIATYGYLYNWYAVADERNIAPAGWRMPDINDWNTLIDYLGGDTMAANKLKEVGNLHWEDPFESDNSSGFTALPGGFRYRELDATYIGSYGSFWSMSEYNYEAAAFLFLHYFDQKIYRGVNFKENGYSVRCIKE